MDHSLAIIIFFICNKGANCQTMKCRFLVLIKCNRCAFEILLVQELRPRFLFILLVQPTVSLDCFISRVTQLYESAILNHWRSTFILTHVKCCWLFTWFYLQKLRHKDPNLSNPYPTTINPSSHPNNKTLKGVKNTFCFQSDHRLIWAKPMPPFRRKWQ